jgi:cytochrome c oxidase subunit 4
MAHAATATAETHHPHGDGYSGDHSGGDHHGPTWLLLFGIFVVLMILTVITVGVTTYDFGYRMNLVVALVIAFVKATLVGIYFMHLRWDPPIFSYVLVASLAFVTLFIVFSLLDTAETLDYVEQRAVMQASQP